MGWFSKKTQVERNLERNSRNPQYQYPDAEVRSVPGSGSRADRAREQWENSQEHLEEIFREAEQQRREFEEERREEEKKVQRQRENWYYAQKIKNELHIDPFTGPLHPDWSESNREWYERLKREKKQREQQDYENWLNTAGNDDGGIIHTIGGKRVK